jgi:recombination protein RecA
MHNPGTLEFNLNVLIVFCLSCVLGYCAFVDAEHALDPSLAEAIGVDTSNLLLSQPDSAEQALSLVDTLIRSGSVDVVVVDSVRP